MEPPGCALLAHRSAAPGCQPCRAGAAGAAHTHGAVRRGARLDALPVGLHALGERADVLQVGQAAHLLADPAGGAALRVQALGREAVPRAYHARLQARLGLQHHLRWPTPPPQSAAAMHATSGAQQNADAAHRTPSAKR